MASKPKVYLICGIITAILFVVCLVVGIFCIAYLPGILKSKAANEVVLAADTHNDWGEIPGGYNANVTRRYIFFNFTNPFEVFYFNQTPVFVELPSQLYAENQNLTDPVYSPANDPTIVSYNYQGFYTPIVQIPQNITTLNLGSLGFWYSAQSLPDHQVATYGLAALISSLELDIVTTLQSAAIQKECVPDQNTTFRILNSSGISDPDLQNLMWNDPVNGLGALSTLTQWVHAIASGPDSGAAKILGDYFYLTYNQVSNLFAVNGTLQTCANFLNSTVASAYNCTSDPCDPNYFVDLQWATQNITTQPASHIIPAEPSVTFFNRTVDGYPEISYFLTEYFIPNENVSQTEYNITFTVEQAEALLNFTPSAENITYCTDQDTLLNFGNLQFLFQIGKAFDDANDTSQLSILQPVMDRFNLPSLQHAHVVYKYVQYILTEFIEKQSLGGDAREVILGEFVSSALYSNFSAASDFVAVNLTATLIMSNITLNNINCTTLLTNSAITINPDQAENICQTSLNPFNLDTINLLALACDRINGPEFNELLQEGGFTSRQLTVFCETEGTYTFVGMLRFSQQYLKDWYNCSQSYPGATRCSNNELAVMQWASSAVTLNVPPLLSEIFPSTNSLNGWDSKMFPKPFEYLAVLTILQQALDPDYDLQPIDPMTANQLLTFNYLLCSIVLRDAFLYFQNQMWDEFGDLLLGVDAYPMILYLRYMMMDVALGGFYQVRTPEELLWGYTDPILSYIQQSSPLTVGDPSIPPVVNLAGVNCSYDQAYLYPVSMYTGSNDSSLTRKYISFYGQNFITYNYTYFDGNQTQYQFVTPWAENVTFAGTDGVVNTPGLETSDNVTIYISDVNYQADLTYSGYEADYSGLNALRYILPQEALLNKTNNPSNSKWFADRWNGVINVSTAHRAPLFVSKGHFYGADAILANSVVIYADGNNATPITASSADELYVDIEPYSGAAVGTSATLQINYEFKQDLLFANPNYALLPVMTTQRAMTFNSAQVSQVFGPLKMGLTLKHIGPIIGFVFAGIFLIVSIFCFYRRRMLLKKIASIQEGSYGKMDVRDTRPNKGGSNSGLMDDSGVETSNRV